MHYYHIKNKFIEVKRLKNKPKIFKIRLDDVKVKLSHCETSEQDYAAKRLKNKPKNFRIRLDDVKVS